MISVNRFIEKLIPQLEVEEFCLELDKNCTGWQLVLTFVRTLLIKKSRFDGIITSFNSKEGFYEPEIVFDSLYTNNLVNLFRDALFKDKIIFLAIKTIKNQMSITDLLSHYRSSGISILNAATYRKMFPRPVNIDTDFFKTNNFILIIHHDGDPLFKVCRVGLANHSLYGAG